MSRLDCELNDVGVKVSRWTAQANAAIGGWRERALQDIESFERREREYPKECAELRAEDVLDDAPPEFRKMISDGKPDLYEEVYGGIDGGGMGPVWKWVESRFESLRDECRDVDFGSDGRK